MPDDAPEVDVDVVVVGAGMAGLYSLYLLREKGFTAVVLEQGDGVGGTWFWNRYPGARCDVPSLEYSFGFSNELQQDWEWSEIFPGQAELEAYFNHVADRFDLRRDLRLSTRVTAATYDEPSATWLVETDQGDALRSRFVIMATGCLSVPMKPDVPGVERFGGEVVQTSLWPREGVELEGERVALIGTGSSGVQSTPEIAKIAEHLYVFQRTPTYTWPSFNGPLDPEVQAETKRVYPELRKRQRETPGGVTAITGAIIMQGPEARKILEATDEERAAVLEELEWGASRAWSDIWINEEANEIARDMYRTMVHRTVEDSELADRLTPKDYPIGCKRPVVDSHYFDAYNRDNVTLVDLRDGGIDSIDETGVQTAQGHFDVDLIVFATGFDAMTGALFRIDIRGRDGVLLRDAWADGPHTLLGLQTVGFPNLFTVNGPQSPSVLANMVVCVEHHVEWIGKALTYVRDHGYSTMEPTREAQDAWVEHSQAVSVGTMFTAESCNSWYVGANIPGKPRIFMPYVGGLTAYIEKAEAAADAGYEGFTFD